MSNEAEKQNPLRADAVNVFRGLCMGCADVVPGVSGGTVALILGIYERLVTAISHVDSTLLSRAKERDWQGFAKHLDLRFLIALGGGIGVGMVGMTLVINRLLTHESTRSITLAVFFGMIFASAILVASMIQSTGRDETIRCLVVGAIGAGFAYWVSILQNSNATDPSYLYVFFCGCIAICAMILPGISGAMILLVLGIYVHLTEIPHNVLAGEHISQSLLTVAVFGSGCLFSLILFSKFLRWLLSCHHAITMAVLCGFMFGALRKLWPFQEDTTPGIEEFKLKKFDAFFPSSLDGQVLAVMASAAIAIGFVFAVDRFTRRPRATRR